MSTKKVSPLVSHLVTIIVKPKATGMDLQIASHLIVEVENPKVLKVISMETRVVSR